MYWSMSCRVGVRIVEVPRVILATAKAMGDLPLPVGAATTTSLLGEASILSTVCHCQDRQEGIWAGSNPRSLGYRGCLQWPDLYHCLILYPGSTVEEEAVGPPPSPS